MVAELYNPENPNQKRVRTLGPGLSGSFVWNGQFDDDSYCPTNAAYGRIKIKVQDHLYDATYGELWPVVELVFEQPILAILYPSHRFHQESSPYCYADYILSERSLSLELGWNQRPAPAGIFWQCSWGTITNPSASATTYQAGHLDPDDPPTIVMLTVTADNETRTRAVFVFPDNLGRDTATFIGQTASHPLPWWSHAANCHGATRHAHNGSGTLNNAFWCPWCLAGNCENEEIYNANNDIDIIDTYPKQRKDIIEYAHGEGPGSHSATLTGSATATWEVNGGIPSNNHFREDVILRDLAPIIRLHGPQRPY